MGKAEESSFSEDTVNISASTVSIDPWILGTNPSDSTEVPVNLVSLNKILTEAHGSPVNAREETILNLGHPSMSMEAMS